VVAVSGGPDSVALTLLLRELAGPGSFALAGLAHLNHGLRGADADADQEFCRELAARLDLPFVAERAGVRAEAERTKTSIESAARALRYDFLERARVRLQADLVAVGHTRDDQAETYLLRLIRGAGPRGLTGIKPRRGAVVRPLLEVGRGELHAWLRQTGEASRVDATNEDRSIPRNAIRHDVLPRLERVAPGASRAIVRAAAIASDDERFLEARATEAAAAIVLLVREAGKVVLKEAELKALDPAIARRVVRQALSRVAPARSHGLAHVDAVLDLSVGRGLDLPGVHVSSDGGRISLEPGMGRTPKRRLFVAESNVFRYSLSIPGEACIPEAGVAISAEFVISWAVSSETKDVVGVNAARAGGMLYVRGRRPGDRFRLPGTGGRKKLQDYLVDRKVPRAERDRLPLVVDAQDRIVWVVGHAVADDYRATAPGEAVLLLKVRDLGDIV